MKQYLDAVQEVLDCGTRKENRTGIDTISKFNTNYEVDLRHGFPLLTTKEISWKNIVVENLWFLSGDPHIAFLRRHNCKFWDAWADADGYVPSAYGNFWRRFPTGKSSETHCDQIAALVQTLKSNPMSRRMLVTAWAPGNALASALPPCHVTWILNVQQLPDADIPRPGSAEYAALPMAQKTDADQAAAHTLKPHLCLHLTQRSADMALGVPYNIAGYALLLELFSRFSGIPAGIFAHTLVDAHIYTQKVDGASSEYDHIPALHTQLTRAPRARPRLKIADSIQVLEDLTLLYEPGVTTGDLLKVFKLENYRPYGPLKFKVAV